MKRGPKAALGNVFLLELIFVSGKVCVRGGGGGRVIEGERQRAARKGEKEDPPFLAPSALFFTFERESEE